MARKILIGTLLLCIGVTGAWAQTNQRWLHVRVDGSGSDGERVRINLPLELVASILPLIEADDFQRGKVRLDLDDLEGIDMAALVATLRNAKDGEYVTVEDGDEEVHIKKSGDHLLVHVDEDGEQVDIRIRFAVVDALFSGEAGEIDLLAAVEALQEEEDCELVRVDGGDETVRIWIDQKDFTE
ncbi:MAG: hypothetical protein V1774_01640 [Candidatus Eisenbacteria bacterium]